MEPNELSVPPTLARRVEKLARQERRTPAALLREMLRLYERYKQKQEEDPYTEEWAMNLVREAEEKERLHPMTAEEEEREEAELQRYGAAQAKKLGIKSDKDVDRLIQKHRKERRETARPEKKPSLLDTPFCGMWADRADISDERMYARQLRQRLETGGDRGKDLR